MIALAAAWHGPGQSQPSTIAQSVPADCGHHDSASYDSSGDFCDKWGYMVILVWDYRGIIGIDTLHMVSRVTRIIQIYLFIYLCSSLSMSSPQIHWSGSLKTVLWIGHLANKPVHGHAIMTSSNGNIFRVTGSLWGIPLTKASDGALMFSLNCAWTKRSANNRYAGDVIRHRAHYDITVMCLSMNGPFSLCARLHSTRPDL